MGEPTGNRTPQTISAMASRQGPRAPDEDSPPGRQAGGNYSRGQVVAKWRKRLAVEKGVVYAIDGASYSDAYDRAVKARQRRGMSGRKLVEIL